jgi:hypothetical protein
VTDDLLVWLREQLDEDERAAREAHIPHPWYSADDLSKSHHDGGAGLNDFEADHIARWDPARVLREVEARRRMVEFALRLDYGTDEGDLQRLLALPYSDHPGYRQEWAP